MDNFWDWCVDFFEHAFDGFFGEHVASGDGFDVAPGEDLGGLVVFVDVDKCSAGELEGFGHAFVDLGAADEGGGGFFVLVGLEVGVS